ncbi:alpha-amylase family glycosyl hydrolase [Fictibacillus barbaricus]|uniref:Sucrose phosphorylase n=1 Tax=Fictibacillus barbaricus TaxID=182136 RepID=A0ABS2ZEK5_9BACL|nr:alpha-amylase family glycosyl hydrolase [Fictibacillus barbaricus]MBN3546618.1 alpha-amylase [Fictibacillus barbaricus]GGB42443.1 sucrose phosphorylase [Fictibacillus barbaricus]
MSFSEKVEKLLKTIYGEDFLPEYKSKIVKLAEEWKQKKWSETAPLSEKNVYLITYGDIIKEDGEPTLKTLNKFINEYAKNEITDVHLLPMFPYTSDDGFSVVDYREIRPDLGDWSDIERFSGDYRLMFDFVANHMSKSSKWFQGYLKGEPEYADYFIPRADGFDASNVVRPRTSPLFHEYAGGKTAWTTFSEDQVDVNFRHFPALLEMTDILLEYAYRGGTSIRLDAIGFMWKESGTTCIHLPQTHAIIQLWREILEELQLNTLLITETNVPHKENISYFGDGEKEAHMVYQFSLPPLVLHTLTTHDASKLTGWAKTINKVSDSATYFNFLASHDGIGMRPTEGILTEEERSSLAEKVLANGGRVSYKSNPDGTESPYELNINYMDALINKDEDVSEDAQVQKMLAAHSVLFSVMGVPAVYYHSLLGSQNDYKGLEESGINRRINRQKFQYEELVSELEKSTRRQKVFTGLKKLIRARQQEPAFSPFAAQLILELGEQVFALLRRNEETGDTVLFVMNAANVTTSVELPFGGEDLWSGETVENSVELAPYQFMWIKK